MKFGDMLIVGMLAFGVWSAMRKPKGKIQFDPTNGLPVPPEYFKPLPSQATPHIPAMQRVINTKPLCEGGRRLPVLRPATRTIGPNAPLKWVCPGPLNMHTFGVGSFG